MGSQTILKIISLVINLYSIRSLAIRNTHQSIEALTPDLVQNIVSQTQSAVLFFTSSTCPACNQI
jgi:hypothetical protein